MPSSVLVKDALWRAGTLLMDVSPQWVRYSEQQLCAWLDDAQMAIVKYLPSAGSRIDAINLKTGTRQSIDSVAQADLKPGDGSTPAGATFGLELLDVIRDMGTDGATPGNVVRRVERAGQDAVAPDWHTKTGAVPSCFIYDPRMPRNFYVSPSLSARRWVEVAWAVQPKKTAFGAAGSELYSIAGASPAVLQVGDEHLDDVVNYIVARANMAPVEWADGTKAQAFAGAFLQSLNALVAARTGNNPNLKVLPFAPDIGRAAQ